MKYVTVNILNNLHKLKNMNKFDCLIKLIAIIMGCAITCSCAKDDNPAPDSALSLPTDELIVMNVRNTDRLYTTEYVVHKAVTYDDIIKLKGTIFSKNFDFTLPQGDRKIIIPMEARIKAYIDFGDFSKDNIIFSPDSAEIRVMLPDPKVELTSTRIDHSGVLTFVDFGRSRFTSKEMSDFERQGRAAIIAAIPQMGIIETARRDAYALISPMITAMGYPADKVTVDFRSDLSEVSYLQSLIGGITSD